MWNFVIPHSETPDKTASPRGRPCSAAKKPEAKKKKKKPCPFCDYKYFQNEMAVHIMEIHFRVLEDDTGFPLRMVRKLWAKDIVDVSCKACQIEFTDKLEYQLHLSSHLRLACLVCSHVFAHYESLLNHMKKHELGGSSEARTSSSPASRAGSEKLSSPPSKKQRISPEKPSLEDRLLPVSVSPPPSGTRTTLEHCNSSSLTSADSYLQNDEAHGSNNSVIFNDDGEDPSLESETSDVSLREWALEIKLKQPIVLLTKNPDIDKMCEALESEVSQYSISSVSLDIDNEKDEEESSPTGIHRPGPSMPSLFDFDSIIDDFGSKTDSASPQKADANSSLNVPDEPSYSSATLSDEISLVQGSFGESTSDLQGKPGSRTSTESFEISIETPQKIKKRTPQKGRKGLVSPHEIKNLKTDLLNVDVELPKKRATKKIVYKYPSEVPYQETAADGAKKLQPRSPSAWKKSRFKKGPKSTNLASGGKSRYKFAFKLDILDNADGGPRATVDVKLVDNSVDVREYSMTKLTGDAGTRSFRWIEIADYSPYSGTSSSNALVPNPLLNLGQDPKYSDRSISREEISDTRNSEDPNNMVILSGMESSMPENTSGIDSPKVVVVVDSWTSEIMNDTDLKISRRRNSPNVGTYPRSSDRPVDRVSPLSHLPDVLGTRRNLPGGCENSRSDDGIGPLGNVPDAASKGGQTPHRINWGSDNKGGLSSLFLETQRNIPGGSENSRSDDVIGPLSSFPDTASKGGLTPHRINWGSDNEGGSPTLFGPDFGDDDSRISPECPLQSTALYHDPDIDNKKSPTTASVNDSGEVFEKGGWGFGSDYGSEEESTHCDASARAKEKSEPSKKPEPSNYSSWKQRKQRLNKILQDIDELGPNIGTTKDRTDSHADLLSKSVSPSCNSPFEDDRYFGLSDPSEPGPSCSSLYTLENPPKPNKAHPIFGQDGSTDSSDLLLRTPEYGSPFGSPQRPSELTPRSFSPINSDDDSDLSI